MLSFYQQQHSTNRLLRKALTDWHEKIASHAVNKAKVRMAKSWAINRALSLAFNGWRVFATKMAVMKTRADRLRRNRDENEQGPRARRKSVLAAHVLGESPMKGEHVDTLPNAGRTGRRVSISSQNITGRRRSDVGLLLGASRKKSIASESIRKEIHHISSRTRMMLQLGTRRSSLNRTVADSKEKGRLTQSDFAKIGKVHRSRRRSSWSSRDRQEFVKLLLRQMTLKGLSAKHIAQALRDVAEVGRNHIIKKSKFREALVYVGISIPKREINTFFDSLDVSRRGEINFQEFLHVLSSHRELIMEENARRVFVADSDLEHEVSTCIHPHKVSSRSVDQEVQSHIEEERAPRQEVHNNLSNAYPHKVSFESGSLQTIPERGSYQDQHIKQAANRIRVTWRETSSRQQHRERSMSFGTTSDQGQPEKSAVHIQRLIRGYQARMRYAKWGMIRAARKASSQKIASM